MLKIVNYNCDEYEFPCLIVLGCFDAVHAGHVELLKKAKLQAKINGLDLGVMVFSEGKSGKQVFTFDEKLEYLESFNVKFVLKIDFTEEFKKTKPLEFLQTVEDKINVKAYMSGKDFRFGAGAKGKSSTLKTYAEDEENGVWYMPVKDVISGDEKISTTLIRKLLAEGDVKRADELLGRNYFVCSEVVEGAARGGKTLGFPTLNMRYPEKKSELKFGVYSVKCAVEGAEYTGIANYGARPTFGEEEPLLEVYLDGFEGDLYGKKVKVEFLDYIRDIQKFDCADELKEQLVHDLNEVRGTEASETAATVDETETEVAQEITEVSAEEVKAEPATVEETAEPAAEQPQETGETTEQSREVNQTEAVSEEDLENIVFDSDDDGGFDDEYIEEASDESAEVPEVEATAEPAEEKEPTETAEDTEKTEEAEETETTEAAESTEVIENTENTEETKITETSDGEPTDNEEQPE